MERSPFHDKRGKHLTLKELTKNAESIPLSTEDLVNLTGGKCAIVTYEELGYRYQSIPELLANNGRCILLYDLKGGIGHFVSLSFHRNINSLQFYNSYALPPDAEINMFKHQVPVLSDMIREFMQASNVRLDVNRFQHQQLRENSNECGRHAVIRVLNSDMTNSEYNDFIAGFSMKPPELVSLMTMSVSFITKREKSLLLK